MHPSCSLHSAPSYLGANSVFAKPNFLTKETLRAFLLLTFSLGMVASVSAHAT